MEGIVKDFVTGPIYQEICIEAGSFDVIPSKDGSDECSQAEAGTQSSSRGKLRLLASLPSARRKSSGTKTNNIPDLSRHIQRVDVPRGASPCRYTREEPGVSRQFCHSPAGA
ncbi:unnamed protein product [Gadus morhua 'NCC']